jgi:hypothetical protein
VSDEKRQTSSPSSPDSRSGSGSQDVLDGGSVRALTAALEGSNKKHDAHIVAIASLAKAVMENTAAISSNGELIDKLGEYITDFTGQAPDVIMGAKLTIDAASRSNEELAKATKRLEDTTARQQTMMAVRETIEITIAPKWTHRALDKLWPYAEHSAERMIFLALSSMGAGAGLLAAAHAFITWVF